MSTRLLNWRSRLIDWGLSLQGQPFAWGKTDCATLAREALRQCFGRDVAPYLGEWTTARQAQARLTKYPFREQLEALKAEEVSVSFLRAGDILVAPEPDEKMGQMSVMVCLDAHHVLGVSRTDGVRIGLLGAVPDGTKVYSVWEVPDNG